MKVRFLLLAAGIIAVTAAQAKEPENLSIAKARVIRYHDSGEYNQDIAKVIARAKKQLNQELKQKPADIKHDAIILDIDETALSNYNSMVNLSFGGTLQEIIADEDKGKDPAIKPTLALYQYAKSHGFAVFFITGRQEPERSTTIDNLKKAGYDQWDGLILRPFEYKTATAATYKPAMRKQITSQGYHIIMNIGDQESDLRGGYADKTYKLPNPFYFIK